MIPSPYLLLLGLLPSIQACDQCQFVSTDASDCRVYGKIDGTLIDWSRASQECLDAYMIKISTPDPSTAGCGGASPNVNSFVNAIRFGTLANSVLGGLGEDFFVQGANGVYSLNESIVVGGTTYDCEASESDCYNAMKEYFATSTGLSEMQDVCGTLQAKVFVDKEEEQSIARTRLCQEIQSDNVVDACSGLADEVNAQMLAYPNKDCSGFAFGTGTTTIPGCSAPTATGGGGPTSGGAFHRLALLLCGLLVLQCLW